MVERTPEPRLASGIPPEFAGKRHKLTIVCAACGRSPFEGADLVHRPQANKATGQASGPLICRGGCPERKEKARTV